MSKDSDLPLVSVVTAALDPPLDKLVRCLESVEAQAYPRIEHVVVDGGSTNGALDVLGERKRLRWISEPDRGQCDAMNKAIFKQSTGELVVWLNADDVLHPGSVEHAAAFFREDSGLGWVYGNLDVDRRGHRHVIRPPEKASREALDFNNIGFIAPGTMFARWALERVGDLDEDFHMEMDLDLSLRLLEAGVPSRYTPRALALLEIYDGTKSGEVPKRDIALERHNIYLKHGMFQQAGAALALAGRYEISEEIEKALSEGRYRDASAAAATGLRFMPSVLERHRISFWLTRLFPRGMRAVKQILKRI
ncbi:MAG TPA: glycosyltransferase [Solirubrobacterales bacterium]|jgi:glycosyltransferase involved in cell wall biosynthesis